MYRVSPLKPEDIGTVIDLAQRIWRVCYPSIFCHEQIENILQHVYNEENLQKEMHNGHRFWLAWEGERAVGYASGYKEGEVIWLRKLYVLPEVQKQGIGKMLTQAVIDAFLPARELRLMVNSNNLLAQGFYMRTGFTCIDKVPVQMGDFHFTDFIFAKPLA